MSAEHDPLTALRELVEEVWRAHRDIDNSDYNQCEQAECAWCQETRKAFEALSVWRPQIQHADTRIARQG